MKKKAMGLIMGCFLLLTSMQMAHAFEFTITNASKSVAFKVYVHHGKKEFFQWWMPDTLRDFMLMPGETHTERDLGCLLSTMATAYPVDEGGWYNPTGHGYSTGLSLDPAFQCWNHHVQIDNKTGVLERESAYEWTWW
jgi:hypothetical protein